MNDDLAEAAKRVLDGIDTAFMEGILAKPKVMQLQMTKIRSTPHDRQYTIGVDWATEPATYKGLKEDPFLADVYDEIECVLVNEHEFYNTVIPVLERMRVEYHKTGRMRRKSSAIAKKVEKWGLAYFKSTPAGVVSFNHHGTYVCLPNDWSHHVAARLLDYYRDHILQDEPLIDSPAVETLDQDDPQTETQIQKDLSTMKMNRASVIETGKKLLADHKKQIQDAIEDAKTKMSEYAPLVGACLAANINVPAGQTPEITVVEDHTDEVQEAITVLEHASGDEVEHCAAVQLLITPLKTLAKVRKYKVTYDIA